MTDQDLIKRVAEIRGDIFYYDEVDNIFGIGRSVDKIITPLANTPEAKALCWDVAIKERMNLWVSNENDLDVYNAASELASDYHIRDVYSMERAVLLAFVELNKEPNQ